MSNESKASAWLKIIVPVVLAGVLAWAGYLAATLNAIGTTVQLIAANMATCDDVRILHASVLKNHPQDSQFLAIQGQGLCKGILQFRAGAQASTGTAMPVATILFNPFPDYIELPSAELTNNPEAYGEAIVYEFTNEAVEIFAMASGKLIECRQDQTSQQDDAFRRWELEVLITESGPQYGWRYYVGYLAVLAPHIENACKAFDSDRLFELEYDDLLIQRGTKIATTTISSPNFVRLGVAPVGIEEGKVWEDPTKYFDMTLDQSESP